MKRKKPVPAKAGKKAAPQTSRLPPVYTAVRHALSRTSADEQAIRDALAGERKQH